MGFDICLYLFLHILTRFWCLQSLTRLALLGSNIGFRVAGVVERLGGRVYVRERFLRNFRLHSFEGRRIWVWG